MKLPTHFFRLKDNGALVHRVEAGGRERRLDLKAIASVNERNGKINPQGGADLLPEDEAAIAAWLEERAATRAARDAATAEACVETLNRTAQWAQSSADADALEAATEALLLAMHDLRSVLVKKRHDRMEGR